ncbi:hypothetical protein Buni01_04244 [Bacteroides uniformis]
MIQVNRIYLIFNRLVTKKFLVDTSVSSNKAVTKINPTNCFHVLSLLSFFIITLLTIKYLQYRAQRY